MSATFVIANSTFSATEGFAPVAAVEMPVDHFDHSDQNDLAWLEIHTLNMRRDFTNNTDHAALKTALSQIMATTIRP